MYLSSFRIQNIKCFEDAELTFPGKPGEQAGWHVLLGINGTGKSTLLQAMALAMLGPVSGGRLLKQPASWVRVGAPHGEIEAGIATTAHDSSGAGAPRKKPYDAHLLVTGPGTVVVEGMSYTEPQVTLYKAALAKSLSAGPYSNRRGWFSAGYGPFRRLTGLGGEEDASIHHGAGREARHQTLFSESAALTRCEKWLTSLHGQSNDPKLPDFDREVTNLQLETARLLIDGLLPNGVQIDSVDSRNVNFATRSGVKVTLSQLSDGYRSFLALAIDLLRHILEAEEWGTVSPLSRGGASIDTEGVVLIDEADAHLHPTWQRDIGFWMCEAFPRIQFIVSSHSPFVAQAAKEGGLFVVKSDRDGPVTIEHEEDSVRGWRADQILLSPLFGLGSTRDPETEHYLHQHADLLARQKTLTTKQRAELRSIEETLRRRLTAPGDTFEERERERKMQAFIDSRLTKLDEGGEE